MPQANPEAVAGNKAMKQLPLLAILAGVAFLVCLALYFGHDSEPSYNGRSLSNWLDEYAWVTNPARMNSTNRGSMIKEDEAAIKHIGANGIPTLLKLLQTKNFLFKAKLVQLLGRQDFVKFKFRDPAQQHAKAFLGFALLGKDGKAAGPALARMLKSRDGDIRIHAIQSLLFTNPDRKVLLPALLIGLHDTEYFVRFTCAQSLAGLYPDEAETAGVYHSFPDLRRREATVLNAETGERTPLR